MLLKLVLTLTYLISMVYQWYKTGTFYRENIVTPEMPHAIISYNVWLVVIPWLKDIWHPLWRFNKLRPRQNGRHFADVIFKCIFLNENVWMPIKISLKFVPKVPINNIPVLVQIMAWPMAEPMTVSLLTHICVTWPQWVNHASPHSLLLQDLKLAWEHLKNAQELVSLRVLKFSLLNKVHIIQCMGKIHCLKVQRIPLKFYTKYLTHTLKDMITMPMLKI